MPDSYQTIDDACDALFAACRLVMGNDVGHIGAGIVINASMALAVALDADRFGFVHIVTALNPLHC